MLWMGGIVYLSHRDNLLVLTLHNTMEGSITHLWWLSHF